jgi:putative FmdB family regulatory protein
MPIYEYRCGNGHEFEVVQRMTDDPVATCEVCGEPVDRVFRPVAVHFKGSGFYTTDYARKKEAAKSDSGSDSKSGESKSSETKSDSKGSDGSGEKAKSGTSTD